MPIVSNRMPPHKQLPLSITSSPLHNSNHCFENRQSVGGSIGFAFFEILPCLAHGVRHMGEAQHLAPAARANE